jgi:transcriptional regulator with XRE-family HTH domain
MVDWQSKREMSPAEFKSITKSLGMSIAAAGRYLGVAPRTASRYAHGETEIHVSVVLLLRAIRELGIKPVVPSWKSDRNKHW